MTRYNDDISCSAVLAPVFVSSDTMDIMTNKKRIILGIFACCEMEILFSTRSATIVDSLFWNEKSLTVRQPLLQLTRDPYMYD